MTNGSIIVGQSGGPTSVINSSLVGVFKAGRDAGVKTVYGMRNGIEGLLEERYINMADYVKNDLDIELLKRTPSSFLGTCRYKLPDYQEDEAVYQKLFRILDKLDIKHFFYIGGNDSMDTIQKLAEYAEIIGSGITFMGVPKTIDNDLAVTDHTPGYGSAAKYIASAIKELICDTATYTAESVTVVEIMGRNAGWLTAASALSRSEDCCGPDLIYLPECPFDQEAFLEQVQELRKRKPALVIAVSEGIKRPDGSYVYQASTADTYDDPFGHNLLGGTAVYLSDYIAAQTGMKSRGIVFSTLQRCASHIVSRRDVTEAFMAGAEAAKAALRGETGRMVIFKRLSDEPYSLITETCPVSRIANAEKLVPREWITRNNTDVSDEFLAYARPLIIGELTPFMVDGLPRHLHLD